MECPKCGRQISAKKEKCMYCGASASGRSPSTINHKVSKNGNMIISDVHDEAETLQDLPDQVRSKIEDALREGKNEVLIKEESPIVHDAEQEVPVVASLERVLTLLSKMKDTLEDGKIDSSAYDRMALDMIRDYISTLPEDLRLNFVVHEITQSELFGYINEDILRDLRAFVLSSKTHDNY